MTNRNFCWVVALALLAAAPAWAQRSDRELLRQQIQERPQPPRQAVSPREDLRGGDDGRTRLTPEERRQLRRDIGDAGRDLYQRRGPREVRRR
jgi:hypothetical protein